MKLEFTARGIERGSELVRSHSLRGVPRWIFRRLKMVNFRGHLDQELACLWTISLNRGPNSKNILTGLANHRVPPLSNQLRCPPKEVVHSTAYGVCLNSSIGNASLTATYHTLSATHHRTLSLSTLLTGSSSACIAKRGILTASSVSEEDASR